MSAGLSWPAAAKDRLSGSDRSVREQVVIHQDGPVGSPPSLGVGTPMSLSSHESGHSAVEGVNHPPWVGHLCHVESRGPDRRDSSSTAAMGRWDTYAQPYSPYRDPRLLVASCAKRNSRAAHLTHGGGVHHHPPWDTYALAGREPNPSFASR